MTEYTSHIRTPKESFRKARSEYFNWHFAWAREALQNSYDAIRRRIASDPSFDGKGKIDVVLRGNTLIFRDNGVGMDANTLINVLLDLAGSDKKMGEGQTGGFGYAKRILYFANESYEIRTRDNLIVGEGGQYNHEQGQPYVDGCESTVVFESAVDAATILATIGEIGALFDPEIDLTITLNGKALKLGAQSAGMCEEITMPLGKLWYYEGKDVENYAYCNVTVRINGLPMFLVQRGADMAKPIYGVLDLHSSLDLMEVLTASRDSMRNSYGSQLGAFVDKLANDRSAFKHGKKFNFQLNSYSIYELADHTYPDQPFNSANFLAKQMINDGANVMLTDPELQSYIDGIEANIPNFPLNFTVQSQYRLHSREGKEVFRFMSLRKAAILAQTWNECVKFVLSCNFWKQHDISYYTTEGEQFYGWQDNATPGEIRLSGVPIHTGFIFAPGIEGMLANNNVMFNPKVLMEDWQIGDMLDLAVHESVHLLCGQHNENFVIMCEEVRRSLRRYTTEAEVSKWIDSHLRSLGLRGRSSDAAEG